MAALLGAGRGSSVGGSERGAEVVVVGAFFSSTGADDSANSVGKVDVLGAIENVGDEDGTLLVLGDSLALGASLVLGATVGVSGMSIVSKVVFCPAVQFAVFKIGMI